VIRAAVNILGKQAPGWLAAVMLLSLVGRAQAQAPACGPETAGQLSEQAGVRCQCVETAGGSITGEPSGYR
jgi:hypothetical protein